MNVIKAVVLALLFGAVAACGSEPAQDLNINQGLMDHTSHGETHGVRVLATFLCDENTKLRSGFNLKVTNIDESDITVRFTRRKRSLGSSDDGPREIIRDVLLTPDQSDLVEQSPAPPNFNMVVGIFKIEDGEEVPIAHAAIGAADPCQLKREDGGNDL